MIIYMVTNKINGKKYIGQTKNSLPQRKHRHHSDARNHRTTMYFHNALRKYGEKAFEWNVLWEHTTYNKSLLSDMEKYYIKELSPEYNLTDGGIDSFAYTDYQKVSEHNNKAIVTVDGESFIIDDVLNWCCNNPDFEYNTVMGVINGDIRSPYKGVTIEPCLKWYRKPAKCG